MIRFRVWKSKSDGQYRGFLCEGHADYAEEGTDVVCAAVSALTLNTVNAIEQFTGDVFETEEAEEGGYLKLCFPEGTGERASLLMDSLVLGLSGIEAEYGKSYITLNLEEV